MTGVVPHVVPKVPMIVPISEIALGDYKEQLPQCLALASDRSFDGTWSL